MFKDAIDKQNKRLAEMKKVLQGQLTRIERKKIEEEMEVCVGVLMKYEQMTHSKVL